METKVSTPNDSNIDEQSGSDVRDKHYYILPEGRVANNKKDACIILRLGSNAFRNAVKRGEIIKKEKTHKPEGYGKEIHQYQ